MMTYCKIRGAQLAHKYFGVNFTNKNNEIYDIFSENDFSKKSVKFDDIKGYQFERIENKPYGRVTVGKTYDYTDKYNRGDNLKPAVTDLDVVKSVQKKAVVEKEKK